MRNTMPAIKTVMANVSAGPRANSRSSIICPPSILCFSCFWRRPRWRRRSLRRRRPRPRPISGVTLGRGQGLVETAQVPEARFGATQAAVARLDREGYAAVPLQRGAGVVGHRALAAHFEQAPALARAFVIEALGEHAALVERAPVAAVVDGFAEEGLGPAQVVQFRNAPNDSR